MVCRTLNERDMGLATRLDIKMNQIQQSITLPAEVHMLGDTVKERVTFILTTIEKDPYNSSWTTYGP
jgi:hypothetical protein